MAFPYGNGERTMNEDIAPNSRPARRNVGFTLIEMLVVMATLALLLAIAAPQ